MRFTESGFPVDFDSDVYLFHQFLGLTDRMILGNAFRSFTDSQEFYVRVFGIPRKIARELVFDDAAEAGEVLADEVLGKRI